MTTTAQTPRQAGFYMPAEWQCHQRTWMMWPSRSGLWSDIEMTRHEYAAVAHAIRKYEPVTMAVRPEDTVKARSMLGSDIDILEAPLDDSWARDAGPCFLIDGNGNRAGVNFRFNAWGRKYSPFDNDDAFSSTVLSKCGVRQFYSRLIAEGGGVSVDGEGTILTTESCFPNVNRNPDWSRDEIESELKEMLGADKVIWLPGNVEEVETDGHVDGIATFVSPAVVLIETADSPDNPWHEIFLANIKGLTDTTDSKGRPIRLVHIPEAEDIDNDNERFCRSYVNSYIINDAVIMPKYGIPADDRVREIYEELFPDRTMVQVSINHIAEGGGGIHCITQQEPAIQS